MSLKSIISGVVHLFYPHVCTGCSDDVPGSANLLCLRCINDLPHTNYAMHANNPVENIFWGRVPLIAAHSEFYFEKEELVQRLIHQLKYKGNIEIGFYLGELMGNHLLQSNRFSGIDALVPLPLYPDKERKRGYNQAAIICNGMSSVMNIPVITGNIVRQRYTATQTRKHRTERWENVEGSFAVNNVSQLKGKHVLLVDDVITTGATLEACAGVLLNIENIKISIATLAMATK
jgi:ComF family protein